MKRSFLTGGILATAMLMQACVIAPGMTMTEPADLDAENTIQVQPITLELLKQLDVARQTEVRQLANEFSNETKGYIIGTGDVLMITVWDHPELTIPAGSFRDAEEAGQQVGEDGYLFYPYVGLVKADGMTRAELRVVLTDRLSTYIQDPQLDVRVVAYRSKRAYVVGEVNRPGIQPIVDVPMTIADAISLSGGLTANAYKSGVNVSREGKVYEIDLKAMYDYADTNQNMTLQHGDILNVLDRSQQKVFVMGEVPRAGPVEIINGHLSLSAALGEVGGVRQISANPSGIYVVRGSSGDEPQIFHLDAQYATGMLLAERFTLQAQDVVFVDTAGVSQWNRVISQLLPSISIIGIADSIVSP
jgi:polysaccharide export outer membrane protein